MSSKFCAVLGNYPKDVPGGAEYQTYLVSRELSKRGYEAHYVAHNAPETSRIADDGITVHRMSASSNRRSVLQTLESIDADVYYFRTAPDLPLLWSAKHRIDATFVYNISRDIQCAPLFSLGPKTAEKGVLGTIVDAVRYPTYRWLLKTPDIIFAQTEYQQTLLAEHRGLDSTLIGNGHPVPNRPFEKSDPPIVLWLSNIKSVKNPRIFIRVAEACTDLDAQFLMVGRPVDDDIVAHIRDRTAALDNLSYHGGCTPEESNDFFARAALSVHTGDVEGFPNTFIQSWLRETPVVSHCTDPDGILEEHEVGVHSNSEDELIGAVRNLLQDDAHRTELAEQARTYAVENHSIETIVDRIEQRLEEPIEQCRQSIL